MLRLFACLTLLLTLGAGSLHAQGASEAELRAKRLLVRGLTMLQVGDATSARASLEMALHLSPNNPAILAAIADAYLEAGDIRESIHYGGRALTANPADSENAGRLAASYLRDGNPRAARDALDRHRRASPGLSSDIFAARFLAENGSATEALQILESAHSNHGSSRELLYPLQAISPTATDLSRWARLTALVLNEIGDIQLALPFFDADARSPETITELRSMLTMDIPGQASSLTRYASASDVEVRGQSKARPSRDLLAYANANPRDVDAWERAATGLFNDGKIALAHDTAEEATLLFPGNDVLTSIRLRTAVFLGDQSLALTAAVAALRYESNVDLAYSVAAWAARVDDELGDEAREFVRSVSLDDPFSKLVAALSMARDGSTARALRQILDETDGRARDSAELAGLRGLVALVLGDGDMARQWLGRSVELGGEFPLVLESLADLVASDAAADLRVRAAAARSLSK
jgi:tetratricopeptide (TPR) repeat protein